MRACDVMTTQVVSVRPDAPVEEIARKLFEHRISAVPVIDSNGAIVGIVSEGDLMRRSESEKARHSSWWLAMLSSPEEQAAEYVKRHGRQAKDVMTRPVVTVDEDTTLEAIADILERRRIKRVPVVRDDEIVGIVSRANLLHGLVTAKATQPAAADDERIRTAILEALQRDAGVRDQFLNVTVSGGTMHLWGALQSEQERDAVRLVAENTEGVREIEDHLGVMPPQVRSVLWAE